MSTDESAIFDYLKLHPRQSVPVDQIAAEAGDGKDFGGDRNWLLSILRRMEIEGWIESNGRQEYQLRQQREETTTFLRALETPGTPLGDTAIITIGEVDNERREAV